MRMQSSLGAAMVVRAAAPLIRSCAFKAAPRRRLCTSAVASIPRVTLFTKPVCPLCDTALSRLRASGKPFSLHVVNIEDERNANWRARYWCDIPVFHLNGAFWAKHRLSADDVEAALAEAAEGVFEARDGEPDMRSVSEPPP